MNIFIIILNCQAPNSPLSEARKLSGFVAQDLSGLLSISDYVGPIKGRTAILILNNYKNLKKPYLSNHFWSRGYCFDTVGLDSEMIRKYFKYQEVEERKEENQNQLFE